MMDFSSIDLSTSDPNPTLDTPSADTASASTLSDVLSVADQWGGVIGSIVTGTPVASVQQPDGSFVPVGAAPTVVPASANNHVLLIAVVAIAAVAAVLILK